MPTSLSNQPCSSLGKDGASDDPPTHFLDGTILRLRLVVDSMRRPTFETTLVMETTPHEECGKRAALRRDLDRENGETLSLTWRASILRCSCLNLSRSPAFCPLRALMTYSVSFCFMFSPRDR